MSAVACQMNLDAISLQAAFDKAPMGFSHDLHLLPHFQSEGLERLAAAYAGHQADYFVAGSAATPGMAFYAVPTIETTPLEALARLEVAPTRLLLKRPERYDLKFRDLVDGLFDQVARLHGGLCRSDIVRLESAILVTSAASTTPFHFDPEIGFFSQIEGEKTYHVYAPDTLQETELEQFYQSGKVDIGQVDMAARGGAKEYVFDLVPGKGLHQPQNAPHWVQTRGTRSVSYTFVFETRAAQVRSRARGFNHYIRATGVDPRAPGLSPMRDAAKSRALQVLARARRAIR